MTVEMAGRAGIPQSWALTVAPAVMAATPAPMAMVVQVVRGAVEQSAVPAIAVCYRGLTGLTVVSVVLVVTVVSAVWAVLSLAMAVLVVTVEPVARVEQADRDKKAWTLYCPARTADLVATAAMVVLPASVAVVVKAVRPVVKGSPEKVVTAARVVLAVTGVKGARVV